MAQLITVHEFVDSCNHKCVVRKERCARYHTVRGYLTNLETRFEQRRDVIPCETLSPAARIRL